jgi:hypothetical protein
MTAPLVAKQTNYLKNNVPYYKYYQTTDVPDDSETLFSSATATIGGQSTYSPAYSFKGAGNSSGNFPTSGSGMTTSIITPSTYNNKDLTLSAWIKPSQNSESSKTIWGCHSDSTQSGISFGMDDANAGKLKFHAKGYGAVLRSSSYLYANNWYFIVCVYDRTNMQMRIYINGTLDSSQTISASNSDMNLILGNYIWKAGFWSPNGATTKNASQSASQNFLGNIINCCTWYRALSQSEITTLYNGGNGLKINTSVEPYTDVQIAYPMNETSGTVAYSAISGQDTGLYGSNTSYNQHVADSVFAGTGVVPMYLYVTGGDNWYSDLPVSSSAEFVSDVILSRSIVPTKVTLTFNNTTPKNPQSLTIQGSTNGSNWTNLTTVSVPSNTNQVIEQEITSSTLYNRFRAKTTSAYTNDGITINNIRIDGYYEVTSEVGQHDTWDTRTQEGTHTILSSSSDYDTIEYQNKEYEVQNV